MPRITLDDGSVLYDLPADAATAGRITKIVGDLDLNGYAHPLPNSLTTTGCLYLEGYDHPLPRSLAGDVPVPIIPDIDRSVLAAVTAASLDMNDWHTCETTHCRAGWHVHLAGEAGYALEARVGPAVAGALIYEASRPGVPRPDFYCDNETAMADIRLRAEQAPR